MVRIAPQLNVDGFMASGSNVTMCFIAPYFSPVASRHLAMMTSPTSDEAADAIATSVMSSLAPLNNVDGFMASGSNVMMFPIMFPTMMSSLALFDDLSHYFSV